MAHSLETSAYQRGDLRRLLHEESIASSLHEDRRQAVIIVHSSGHGSSADLALLQEDLRAEGFSFITVSLADAHTSHPVATAHLRRAAESGRVAAADLSAGNSTCYDDARDDDPKEIIMPQVVAIELELPDDLASFQLPPGVNARLQELLDRQDRGIRLNEAERREAEGLVDLAELLTLLRLRAERLAPRVSSVKSS